MKGEMIAMTFREYMTSLTDDALERGYEEILFFGQHGDYPRDGQAVQSEHGNFIWHGQVIRDITAKKSEQEGRNEWLSLGATELLAEIARRWYLAGKERAAKDTRLPQQYPE